ncbi:MAG: response regulator transcription factor [Erysipelotrichaceae bacterium]|nr:response regulator transcription factor [Erysipelotrichaceae bacterium]
MKYLINIVDDEKNLNDLVRTYLEKEGYCCQSFYTYDQAYAHVDDDVHLWIIDIMLDKNSGFDLLTEVKNRKPDMPIIFMSARDQDFDRIIGLEKGSDEYITKPFNMKEFLLRTANVLKRVYKDTPQYIEIDGYSIDEAKRKIIYEQQEIDLTTKEYELLLYFVKNRGIAIEREQVLTKVWDENYFGSDRVVDDTLRRLRKKMPNINIKTIYGYGYRLD